MEIFEKRGIGVFGANENLNMPTLITVKSGASGSLSAVPVMALAFSGQVAENYQAVKSFEDNVYITLFGQALSMFDITCMTMPEKDVCENAKSLLASLKTLYKQYRIGNPDRPIITINIDDLTIKGFLVAMPVGTKSTGGINSLTFTLKILGQVIL